LYNQGSISSSVEAFKSNANNSQNDTEKIQNTMMSKPPSSNNNETNFEKELYSDVNRSSDIVSSNEIRPDYISFHSADYGIEISYPSEWDHTVYGLSNPIVEFSLFIDSMLANPYLTVEVFKDDIKSWGEPTNLDDYLKASIEGYNPTDWPKFHIIDSRTNAKLAGYPAYEFTAIYDSADGEKKIKEIGTIKEGFGYYIRYIGLSEAYSKNLPTVNTMISTFKITN
jgi:hypothetical protein